MTPRVTVVVPARNEASDIADCLAAIAAQDVPLEHVEVIVVDGGSTDGTADVAAAFLDGGAFGSSSVLHNAEATTPSNLNCGLAAAQGDHVVRVDARSIVPPHYVRTVVDVLDDRPEVAVVGGAQRAIARGSSPLAIGIARALNNRWSTGLARYRRTDASGPADTVYLGAFRTEQLRAAGGWDMRFATNQDFELNRRMGQYGMVWFVGDLAVGYRPRTSLAQLWRQYVRFGRWKAFYWSTTGDGPQRRQLVLAVAPAIAGVGMLGTWARRGARPVLAVLSGGMGALLVVERVGADEPPASLAGHLLGAIAIATTSAGWLLGVYSGLLGALRGRPRPPQ